MRRSWLMPLALASLVAGATGDIRASGGGGSSLSAAPGWVVTDLGDGYARAINDRGQIIGNGCTAECPDWAVLWQRSKKIALVPHPNDEGGGSTATAINDRGQIVGSTFTGQIVGSTFTSVTNPSENRYRAFLWQNGKTIFLPNLPGRNQSQAGAVDERGRAVGWSGTTSGRHAVLWQYGRSVRDLGTLGGTSSAARGINERGHVVGWSETRSGERHAFLWQNGRMLDLGTLGGKGSEAFAINERREIIGISFTSTTAWGAPIGPVHGFLWRAGKMIDLGRLAETGWDIAINDRSEVAGTRATSGGKPRAFRWAGGRITYLGMPRGVVSSEANAINDRGRIVGRCSFKLNSHACLWENGRTIDLGVLGPANHGGKDAAAAGLNDRGDIVGNSQGFMDFSHAVLWSPRGN